MANAWLSSRAMATSLTPPPDPRPSMGRELKWAGVWRGFAAAVLSYR